MRWGVQPLGDQRLRFGWIFGPHRSAALDRPGAPARAFALAKIELEGSILDGIWRPASGPI